MFFQVDPYLKWICIGNFFPNFLLIFGGFLNQPPNWRQIIIVLETNTFGDGDERVHPGDEHFIAGDERIENAYSNFSHTHTANYQWLPNRPYVQIIATYGYSPPKTGGFTLSYSPLSKPKKSSTENAKSFRVGFLD